jgi:hypothetical protein
VQTYALKRLEEIKPAAGGGRPESKGGQAVRKVRQVTVAEGLSWAEAKRQRNLDRSLSIVPEAMPSVQRRVVNA